MKARILKKFEDEIQKLDRELKAELPKEFSARASWATCARTRNTTPRRNGSAWSNRASAC